MHWYVASRNVFNCFLKLPLPTAGSLRYSGNELQTDGPATEKPVGQKNSTGRLARYVQKLSPIGSETLPRCDCGAWEAEVDQVLGCLAFQTAVHHDAQLVLDSLGYV